MKILELSDIYQEVVSEKTLNDILFPNITDSYYINSTGKEKPKSSFIPQFVFFFFFTFDVELWLFIKTFLGIEVILLLSQTYI